MAAASAPALRKWTCATSPRSACSCWSTAAAGSRVPPAPAFRARSTSIRSRRTSVKSIEILQDGASADLRLGCDRRRGAERHHGRRLRHAFKISGYGGQYGEGDGGTSGIRHSLWLQRANVAAACSTSATRTRKPVNTAETAPTSKFPDSGLTRSASARAPRWVGSSSSIRSMGRFREHVAPNAGVCEPGIHALAIRIPTTSTRSRLKTASTIQPYNHLRHAERADQRLREGRIRHRGPRQIPRAWRASTTARHRAAGGAVPLYHGPRRRIDVLHANNRYLGRSQIYNPFGIDLLEATPTANMNYDHRFAAQQRPGRASSTRTWTPGTCPAASTAISRSAAARCTGMSRASSPRTTRRQTKLNQFNARSINVAMGDPAVMRRNARAACRSTSSAKDRSPRKCWTTSPTRASTPAARSSPMSPQT